jgi:CRISPR-associated protein Cmr3
MSGQWVFIEAADVWLFRDNKPFTAQQNFVARGQFPPTPMTTQGVVRSYYLESRGVDWNQYRAGDVADNIIAAVGLPAYGNRPATIGDLRVTGPFVARVNERGQVERLVRTPLDLLHNEEQSAYRLLVPADKCDFETNMPFEAWRPLVGGGDGFKEASGWLTEAQFTDYLTGNIDALRVLLRDSELFQMEDRVGLALDYSRRTNVQSMFYHAEFVRPCERVGLLVHVNLNIFEDEAGVVSIGGEARSGFYRVVDAPRSLPTSGEGRVRITLLTPAYFSKGWQPVNDNWSLWVGSGRLVSIIVGKPQLISGWDIANNRPKPLRHHLPAGSVFFFEDADVQGIPFTENPPDSPDYGAMGFGAFAVGIW